MQKLLKNGKIFVNFPDKKSETKVRDILITTLTDNFCLDEVKKLMPKTTITNTPQHHD